ncbi:MAG: hypothetical protein AB7E85_01890 [Pseudobdellovibrionaceae bacterium]
MAGDKPVLDPAIPSQKWLYEFADKMYERLFLCEEPFCHFTLPGDTDDSIEYKGVTSGHPLSFRMVEQQEEYKRLIGSDKFFHLTGSAYAARNANFNFRALPVSEPIIIPAEGDFVTLSHLFNILEDRLNGVYAQGLKSVPAPLLIDNTKGVWTDFLAANFTQEEQDRLKAEGVSVVTDKDALVPALKTATEGRDGHNFDMILPPGAAILQVTGNSKKPHEKRAADKFLGVKTHVVRSQLIFKNGREAAELSHTYSGNNTEKLDAAEEALNSDLNDPRTVARDMRRFGFKPETTYLLAEDRGLVILQGDMSDVQYAALFKTPEFADFDKYLNPHRGGPGVELAHVLKGCSIESFYDRLRRACERVGYDGVVKARDYTAYQLRKFIPDPDWRIDTFGVTDDIVHFDVRPDAAAQNRPLYSEDFLEDTKFAGLRKDEVKDYIERHSSVAKANMAMAAVTGADQHAQIDVQPQPFEQFNRSANLRVATQMTALSFMPRHSTHGVRKKIAATDDFEQVSVNDNFDFTRKPVDFTLNTRDGRKVPYPSTLNKFMNMVGETDIFLFDTRWSNLIPDGKSSKRTGGVTADQHKIYEQFQFFNMVVGKQVSDPHILNKPFLVNEERWADCLEIYHDLHVQGLLGDKPEHIYTVYGTQKEGVEKFEEEKDTYIRHEAVEDEIFEDGEDRNDLFKVTIYCSATSTNGERLQRAYDLSRDLAADGYGIVNGGGSKGLMERVSASVMDLKAERPDLDTFLKVIQCEETCRAEGMFEGADKTIVMPNIYLRMEELQKVQAEVVLDGGAGTVQEVLASLITRMNNRAVVENRPMVIVNSPSEDIHNGGRVFDIVLKHLPSAVLRECNVHVVDTIQEAKLIIDAARKARGMAPDESAAFENPFERKIA